MWFYQQIDRRIASTFKKSFIDNTMLTIVPAVSFYRYLPSGDRNDSEGARNPGTLRIEKTA